MRIALIGHREDFRISVAVEIAGARGAMESRDHAHWPSRKLRARQVERVKEPLPLIDDDQLQISIGSAIEIDTEEIGPEAGAPDVPVEVGHDRVLAHGADHPDDAVRERIGDQVAARRSAEAPDRQVSDDRENDMGRAHHQRVRDLAHERRKGGAIRPADREDPAVAPAHQHRAER